MTSMDDYISLGIDEELVNGLFTRIDYDLTQFSTTTSESCIFKVPAKLRTENEKPYKPSMITIGHYHRGLNNLQEMEGHKLQYLRLLLQRRNETSVDKYVMYLTDMEERARKCYANPIALNKDEFVKMMLLDGVFLIELFRKWNSQLSYRNDPIFRCSTILDLCSDLLLLENQLPFFILVQLFNMTRDPSTQEDITYLALSFLANVLPGSGISYVSGIPVDDVKHLLQLVHDSMCMSFAKKVPAYDRMSIKEINKFKFINPITELQEAGIEFKVAEESNSLFDIKFENGLMKIPQIVLDEHTESILRNLIAYEQFLPDIHQTYVSDYALFVDCLVNYPKDATTLRRRGIIENSLGDDIMVCDVLNKLSYGVSFGTNFSYVQVFKNVNKHCKSPCNKWMTNLRQKYFNSPWALISFLAAVVLLLLTITQTIFSVLSYFKTDSKIYLSPPPPLG